MEIIWFLLSTQPVLYSLFTLIIEESQDLEKCYQAGDTNPILISGWETISIRAESSVTEILCVGSWNESY